MSNQSANERRIAELDENIERTFEIRKRLGKGAYGIVWKAIDRRTNEIVALKKIFDAFRDETDAQRTYREIVFLRTFRSHPNIIRILDIFKASNNLDFYLVFEYMDSDLHNVIKKGDILKDVHKRFIMYQLLNAIKYMHSGNVVHRDLKPSNILIDSKCRLKVADFGLARTLNIKRKQPENTIDGLEESGNVENEPVLTDYVATRWYRAPEILVASKKYTKGIDMWSLGCILGEMLRQKPLFQGTSTINQIERIISALPEVTTRDINAIGASFGSVLLSKKIHRDRRNNLEEMLRNCVPDAVALVKALLVLDPHGRLTAKEAMRHPYVDRFRMTSADLELKFDVTPPLRDDIRVTVNEYRNNLYEMMETDIRNDKGSRASNVKSGSRSRSCVRHHRLSSFHQSRTEEDSSSRIPVPLRAVNRRRTNALGDAAASHDMNNYTDNIVASLSESSISSQTESSLDYHRIQNRHSCIQFGSAAVDAKHHSTAQSNRNGGCCHADTKPSQQNGVFLAQRPWEAYVSTEQCAGHYPSCHKRDKKIPSETHTHALQTTAAQSQTDFVGERRKTSTHNKELAAVAATASRSESSLWGAPIGVECGQARETAAASTTLHGGQHSFWKDERGQIIMPARDCHESSGNNGNSNSKTVKNSNNKQRRQSIKPHKPHKPHRTDSKNYNFPAIEMKERDREIYEAMRKPSAPPAASPKKREIVVQLERVASQRTRQQYSSPKLQSQGQDEPLPQLGIDGGGRGHRSKSQKPINASLPQAHGRAKQETRPRMTTTSPGGDVTLQVTFRCTKSKPRQPECAVEGEARTHGIKKDTPVMKLAQQEEQSLLEAVVATVNAAAKVQSVRRAAHLHSSGTVALHEESMLVPRLQLEKLEVNNQDSQENAQPPLVREPKPHQLHDQQPTQTEHLRSKTPMKQQPKPIQIIQLSNEVTSDFPLHARSRQKQRAVMEEDCLRHRQRDELVDPRTYQRCRQQKQPEENLHRHKINMQREEEQMHRQALEATRRMHSQLNAVEGTCEKREKKAGKTTTVTMSKYHADKEMENLKSFQELSYNNGDAMKVPVAVPLAMPLPESKERQRQRITKRSCSAVCKRTTMERSDNHNHNNNNNNNYNIQDPQQQAENCAICTGAQDTSAALCYKSRINYLETEMEKCKRELVGIVVDNHRYLAQQQKQKQQKQQQQHCMQHDASTSTIRMDDLMDNGSPDDTLTPHSSFVEDNYPRRQQQRQQRQQQQQQQSHKTSPYALPSSVDSGIFGIESGREVVGGIEPHKEHKKPQRYFSPLATMENEKFHKYRQEQLRRQCLRDFLARRDVNRINDDFLMEQATTTTATVNGNNLRSGGGGGGDYAKIANNDLYYGNYEPHYRLKSDMHAGDGQILQKKKQQQQQQKQHHQYELPYKWKQSHASEAYIQKQQQLEQQQQQQQQHKKYSRPPPAAPSGNAEPIAIGNLSRHRNKGRLHKIDMTKRCDSTKRLPPPSKSKSPPPPHGRATQFRN